MGIVMVEVSVNWFRAKWVFEVGVRCLFGFGGFELGRWGGE